MKKLTLAFIVAIFASLSVFAQNSNSNSSATRQRTASNQNSNVTQKTTPASKGTVRTTGSKTAGGGSQDPTSGGVKAAFDTLVDGIKKADVDQVTSVYWKSPQLILFNSNGTVTRGWDQLRANREASYPNVKDVKLDVKDFRMKMLGREGAIVTCLWTQSQTVKGVPESATGRMTLVFGRVGNSWKIVHLHTSSDNPDPSRVLSTEPADKPAVKAKP